MLLSKNRFSIPIKFSTGWDFSWYKNKEPPVWVAILVGVIKSDTVSVTSCAE